MYFWPCGLRWHFVARGLSVVVVTFAFVAARAEQVTWIMDSSGYWDVPANWSPRMPSVEDDVVIDRPGASPIVAFRDGYRRIASIQAAETMEFTGGTLQVSGGVSNVFGEWRHSGGELLVVGNASEFNASGNMRLLGGDVTAQGAVIRLPGAHEILGRSDRSTRITAKGGPSSRIDLSDVGTLRGSEGIYETEFWTESGGTIDLGGLTSIDEGRVRFSGTSGEIRLDSLRHMGDSNAQAQRSYLGSTAIATQLETVLNTEVAVSDPNRIGAANIRSFNGSALTTGASMSMPLLETYTSASTQSGWFRSYGGTLAIDSLASISAPQAIIELTAGAGAGLSAASLAEVSAAAFVVNSEPGGHVSLAGMASLPAATALNAEGGTIYAPGVTSLQDVGVTISGDGELQTGLITLIERAFLRVEDGASFSLPGLVTLDSDSELRAQDPGSRIDFPALTSVAGGDIALFAENGGQLDLNGLQAVTDAGVRVNAESSTQDESRSRISLNSLSTFVAKADLRGALRASNAIVHTPNLATLRYVDVTVNGDGALDTSGVTSADGCSLRAAGATVRLPALASYDGLENDTSIAAIGGTIEFPALTRLQGASLGETTLSADFGVVDCPSLTAIEGGRVVLQAEDGGAVRMPELQALSLDSYTLYALDVSDSGRIEAPRLTSTRNAMIRIRSTGVLDAPNLATIYDGGVFADSHANATLPTLSRIEVSNLQAFYGVHAWGSEAHAPQLQEIVGTGTASISVRQQDALADLPALTSINLGKAIVQARDSGSRVFVPSLRTVASTSEQGQIEARSGGQIDFGDNPLTVFNMNVSNTSTGFLRLSELRLSAGSVLSGDGSFHADVVNVDGIVSPGGASRASLLIDGNLTQSDAAKLTFNLRSTTSNPQDVLDVLGDVQLDGTLQIIRDTGFVPRWGDTYRIILAASLAGGFDSVLGADLGAGLVLAPDYDEFGVRLATELIADGNHDGIVNGADFTLWSDGFGLDNAEFWDGDYNLDGRITGADFTLWADYFGYSAPLTPIPEPRSAILLAIGALAFAGPRLRLRSKSK